MLDQQQSGNKVEEGLARGLGEVRDRPHLRTAITFATTLCGGLAIVMIAFVLVGQIDPTEAVGMTVAVVVFALIWFVAFWSRHARPDQKRVDWQNRERRGF